MANHFPHKSQGFRKARAFGFVSAYFRSAFCFSFGMTRKKRGNCFSNPVDVFSQTDDLISVEQEINVTQRGRSLLMDDVIDYSGSCVS